MEGSVHYGKDAYGYNYSNQINNYDADIVVFGCEPPLLFDVKAHALKIKKLENSDYDLVYEIRNGALYLSRLEFEPAVLYNVGKIMGAEPCRPYPNKRRCYYAFGAVPVDYTGILSIGKDFDFRFWQGDEKANPTPFCPEVYKQNGFIRFENGRVVETELKPRESIES
ncbi:MAG: hypothetical protein IIX44_03000 [Clostridia bacterium]|nr:hypothetical protein [Clostridia bacterium]